jgi:protein-S-isoprenylcysteine O-methyltransferase Ste14
MFPFDKVIVAVWIIFWVYWLISAFGSKRNTSSGRKQFVGLRLGLFVLAIILFRVANGQNYSFENRVASHNEGVLIVGFVMFLSGLCLAVWARLYLGKNWGMPMTQKQDPELVTTGPYQYIRHPIYSGILLAVLGSGLASSSYWFLYFILAGSYFIYSAVVEERLMAKQFPKVYPEYKRKTKMLIPFVL